MSRQVKAEYFWHYRILREHVGHLNRIGYECAIRVGLDVAIAPGPIITTDHFLRPSTYEYFLSVSPNTGCIADVKQSAVKKWQEADDRLFRTVEYSQIGRRQDKLKVNVAFCETNRLKMFKIILDYATRLQGQCGCILGVPEFDFKKALDYPLEEAIGSIQDDISPNRAVERYAFEADKIAKSHISALWDLQNLVEDFTQADPINADHIWRAYKASYVTVTNEMDTRLSQSQAEMLYPLVAQRKLHDPINTKKEMSALIKNLYDSIGEKIEQELLPYLRLIFFMHATMTNVGDGQ